MLAKLAFGNLRKSIRDYAVYFVTLVLGVAVFYAFNTIAGQAGFLSYRYGDILGMLGEILTGLTVFLALVLGLLMVYANNYLVRRRKKELGLYQVLGMRRGQVSGILALETFMASLVSLGVGLLLGVFLSQILVFVTAALFHDQVQGFRFKFSVDALALTLTCFGIMFAIMLLLNLRTLGRVKLADLMGAHRVNESMKVRSALGSVLLFVLACAFIGCGYWRFLHDGFPITGDIEMGVQQFALTTGLVFAGTILFFYAVAGFVLAVARRLRRVYWRGLNMFTLRQLGSRVNTAALSTGVISLILFLAITSVTGGMSICNVLTGAVEDHTPADATVRVTFFEGGEGAAYEAATKTQDFAELMARAGYDLGEVGSTSQLTLYDVHRLLDNPAALTMPVISEATGASMPLGMEGSNAETSGLDAISVSDFNAWRSLLGLDPIDLGKSGYLITCDMGDQVTGFYNDMLAAGYSIAIDGCQLTPALSEVIVDRSAALSLSAIGSNSGTLVLPDDVACSGKPHTAYVNVLYDVPAPEGDAFVERLLSEFDSSDSFLENGEHVAFVNTCLTATQNWSQMGGVAGMISYMAIYIGFVLVIACAAILAIQQLSSTSDSQGRYRLLSELGCPRELIYRSLLTQTLVYFLLPLVVAVAHSLVALRMVIQAVTLFGGIDIARASLMAVGLFVVVYGGYALVTYRVARGVVHASLLDSARRA